MKDSKRFKAGLYPERSFTSKKDSLIKLNFFKLAIFSALISVVNIFAIFILKDNLPPQVPLFYGLALGEDQLVSASQLTIPAILALSIIGLNAFLSTFFENLFLKQTLILGAFAVSLLSAITTVKIIFLVGSF